MVIQNLSYLKKIKSYRSATAEDANIPSSHESKPFETRFFTNTPPPKYSEISKESKFLLGSNLLSKRSQRVVFEFFCFFSWCVTTELEQEFPQAVTHYSRIIQTDE
eukprot:Lithocolla_globosa_v1_NODE_7056_length_999_cov_15.229873.p1 type:complete len:106 gc:universal NODE_7056_length_999_cov_15.229873:184-501(+)